ncbi:MAG: diguanylate cyclase [Solirubrobacteraceae bacterium]|nr:diguanylate cyclase [Solirubrobacteraceae bacterium]
MASSREDARHGFPALLSEPAAPAVVQELVNGLPAMVGYWDRDLRNQLANTAYRDWFGIGPREIQGMHLRDLLGDALYEQNIVPSQRALAGEQSTFDRTLLDAKGVSRDVQVSYIPDLVDGRVQGFYVLVTEITSRVEAHRETSGQLERYRSIVRNLPNGFIVLFDRDMRYVVADGEALALFGHDRTTLEGRTLFEAVDPALVVTIEPHYRLALAGEQSVWDGTVGHRVLSMRVGPVRDDLDRVIGGVVVATDVTEERRGATIGHAIEEIAKVAADGSTLEQVAERVTQTIHEIFRIDDVGLARFLEDGRAELLAVSGPPTDVRTFDLDGSMTMAQVRETGRPAMQSYDGVGASKLMADRGFRVGGSAPVRVHGKLWGVLGLASRDPDALDEALLDRLESVSELVGLAISNAEAWEVLRQQATTDPVTGLANHRSFHERLGDSISEARREERTCGLVLIDLDHFKQVNDTHGHPVGDAVLREVGRRLAGVARSHELAARVGGEEFALVLHGADEVAAVNAAQRAIRAISDTPFPGVGRVTASAGAAACGPGNCANADHLLDIADRALYAAKQQGRDRVVAAGTLPEDPEN